MSTPTTKAGRDLLDILDRHGVSDDLNVGLGDILAIEDEAAATERRLAVERVRAALPAMMKAALPGAFLRSDDLALGAEAAASILNEIERDALATVDVDEEMAEANREMEADLWNSDR